MEPKLFRIKKICDNGTPIAGSGDSAANIAYAKGGGLP